MNYQYNEFNTSTWLDDTTTIFTPQKAPNPPALPGTGKNPKPWEVVDVPDGLVFLILLLFIYYLIKKIYDKRKLYKPHK